MATELVENFRGLALARSLVIIIVKFDLNEKQVTLIIIGYFLIKLYPTIEI